MINKKNVFVFVFVVCLGILLLFITTTKLNKVELTNNQILNKNKISNKTDKNTEKNIEQTAQHINKVTSTKVNGTIAVNVSEKNTNEQKSSVLKTDLFNSDTESTIPLSTISIISALPNNVKDKVKSIVSNNNVFMTKKLSDKILIITDNPENIRHSIEFIEISLNNGHQVKTTLGYNDKIADSDNDIWEYDPNTKLPLRHSKYNSKGDVDFVENWNYDENKPVKYEMKDADGHVISMRKETLDDSTNLRVEHLVYDKAGNTKFNVSTVYDGADVKRFTYYNADKPSDGGSVYTEYNNGLKMKESFYSNDLKLINTFTSKYKNGERTEVTIWDNKNKEVQKLVSEKAGL